MTSAPRLSARALLLAVVTCLAYAPIFGAGFLNYDDPWLIEHNPFYAPGAWHTPWVVFSDFSFETRFALGAEYLPLRDLLGWLESRVFGTSPQAFHTVSVLLYAGAVLLLRGALLRCLGAGLAVELAALLFALHPVHVESVAWLAGQKDVLALLFAAAALYVHAGSARHARITVPLLVLCAALSKSMSVAVLVLLLAQDLVKKRRPNGVLYAATALVVLGALALHIHVGRIVGMVTEPLGGSRLSALISMGPVWLRYLAQACWPAHLSIAHDVPVRGHWDLPAVAGYALLAAWLLLGVWLAMRGRMKALYTFLWFAAPLAPVSQVLAPLQNVMTDRYLWLSVLAPCLLASWLLWAACRRLGPAVGHYAWQAASVLLVGAAFVMTFQRSVTFSDSVLLFTEGTLRTEHDTDAPYQLGQALEQEQRDQEAMTAYREVLRRVPVGTPKAARTASNNLARLLARHGRLPEAEQVLRSALVRFPADDKLRRNLVKVLRGQLRETEAAAIERALPAQALSPQR